MIIQSIKTGGRRLADVWTRWRQREDVQKALKITRYALFAVIVAYLIFKLTHVGWLEVADNLPASPWFYAFFLLRFFTLPVSELAIYEAIWSTPLLRHFFVFVRKRVYNFAVMGYSGEGFLTLWARRRLPLSDKSIIIGVKDNALLSAFTSNMATVVLIVLLAVRGGLEDGINAFPGAAFLFAIAFLTSAGLAIGVMAFRRKLIAMPPRIMPFVISIHFFRQTMIIALQMAMYASALPGTPIEAWFVFSAMQLVLSRIPLLPNQEVVYLTAALALAPIVGAPEAAVAGMLVAETGLSQALNILLFAATAPLARAAPGR